MSLIRFEYVSTIDPPSEGPFILIFGTNKQSVTTFHLEHWDDMLSRLHDFYEFDVPHEAYYYIADGEV